MAKSAAPKPARKTAVQQKSKSGVQTGKATVSEKTEKTSEELVIENFAAVSRLVETLGETMELLVQKTENMAYHIIATEEILAELVAANGLNLARVNARIRNTIASGTDSQCDPGKAIDTAAAIASPLPRR